MNKNVFVYPVVFLLGTAVGFLVTKKVLEEKYAKLAEEEISSVKERFYANRVYLKKEEFVPQDSNSSKTEVQQEPSGRVTNPASVMARSSIENPYEQAKKNYNLIKPAVPEVEPAGDPEEDDEDCDEDDDSEIRDAAGMTEQDTLDLTKVDRTQPYVIDDTEFSDEFPHHDKISLYYYRADDVLCEESNEDPIDDIESTVGYDALNKLDMQTTVWVRNEPLGIDYEIIALRGSYAETVHGLRNQRVMTPRERYNHIQEIKQKKRENNEEGE